MAHDSLLVRGIRVPAFLYGTAWKEEATADLVVRAVAAGFRGIDTANQRKHYHEAGVGAGLERVFADGLARRDDLFLQTKYTFQRGQDHRLPYDPDAPIGAQVEQSFARSLEHLGVESLDSLVLHGPSSARGWLDSDREAWHAMETLHHEGRVRLLGVSNITSSQLAALIDVARVAPAFVQNRCYASRGWDAEVRASCREHDVVYQGFSLLTANREVLTDDGVRDLATRRGVTPPQLVFAFARAVGMVPLTGTTDPEHMRQDLGALDLALTPEEVELVERAGLAA